MTPYDHAKSSAKEFGGTPEDYIQIHGWFDETKEYTGNWAHRALRHHSAGVEWAAEKFGHAIFTACGKAVPTRIIAERHIIEDCGYIPTIQDWLTPLFKHPESWMLKVSVKSFKPLKVGDK